MNDVILAQYNEVALKLGHRSMFVGRLLQNVRASLKGLPTASVRSRSGRLVVELGSAAEDEVLRRLRVQPGLANLIPARRCRPEVEDIERTAAERSIAVDAMVEKALAERVRERIHPEWELDGRSAAAEL